jgi:HEAT repeat protein
VKPWDDRRPASSSACSFSVSCRTNNGACIILQFITCPSASLGFALGRLGERTPVEPLIQALADDDHSVRLAALKTLGKADKKPEPEILLSMISDRVVDVRMAAIQIIKEVAPDKLLQVLDEAVAVLQQQPTGFIFGSLFLSLKAGLIGGLEKASPDLLNALTEMLDWPNWQVQIQAIQALGKIRRNIPDLAIQRLLALHGDSSLVMNAVRIKANEALGEILSLETGIEDLW